MPDVYEISARVAYLCSPANGRSTGMDCSAVQLAAARWRDHWATFCDRMVCPWGDA